MREKVYLRAIDRKLIVIVIFNSFTDISFLKDFANIFLSLTVFRKGSEILAKIFGTSQRNSKIEQDFKKAISNFACFLTAIFSVQFLEGGLGAGLRLIPHLTFF